MDLSVEADCEPVNLCCVDVSEEVFYVATHFLRLGKDHA